MENYKKNKIIRYSLRKVKYVIFWQHIWNDRHFRFRFDWVYLFNNYLRFKILGVRGGIFRLNS